MSDDFSENVKRVLALRVGNTCSNPACRALTSGPQDDPYRSVNLGVAAHITAASLGGPRYDPNLLPEERSAPANGVWLCQNCAKLVDNDRSRFTTESLLEWKRNAETEARDRVGRTAPPNGPKGFALQLYTRVQVKPVVPIDLEGREWVVQAEGTDSFCIENNGATVDIPKSFIEKIHTMGDNQAALIELNGRLQWVSAKHRWIAFSDKPDNYGIGRDVHMGYQASRAVAKGRLVWGRTDLLPQYLSQGWHIFYDENGRYLRLPGPGVSQILICEQP